MQTREKGSNVAVEQPTHILLTQYITQEKSYRSFSPIPIRFVRYYPSLLPRFLLCLRALRLLSPLSVCFLCIVHLCCLAQKRRCVVRESLLRGYLSLNFFRKKRIRQITRVYTNPLIK